MGTMDPKEVSQIVARSTLLKDLGDYTAATELLVEKLAASSKPSLQLLSELGKSLQCQGYLGRALKVLRDGVAGLPSSSNHNQQASISRIQLEMQICLLEAFVEGNFANILSRSSSLYQDYCQLLNNNQHCLPSVRNLHSSKNRG